MPCHHLLLRVEIFPVSEGDCEWGVHFDDCKGGEILRNCWRCCYFIVYKIYLTWGSGSAEAAWGACTENISFWATDTFSSCQSRRGADPLLSRPPHKLLLQRPKTWLLLWHSLVPDRASLSASYSPYVPLFIFCTLLSCFHLPPPQCHLLASLHLASFVPFSCLCSLEEGSTMSILSQVAPPRAFLLSLLLQSQPSLASSGPLALYRMLHWQKQSQKLRGGLRSKEPQQAGCQHTSSRKERYKPRRRQWASRTTRAREPEDRKPGSNGRSLHLQRKM